MSKFVPVAKESEIPDQAAKCVQIEGKSIALFNLGGQFYMTEPLNAHVKDKLENVLHELVCSGKLCLEEAQKGPTGGKLRCAPRGAKME
jgi:nitrite reductase/ring-hydroxylating ferredoxin subunit